tara:strand:- start:35 stop:373 length:339 start_codon:yes stop_codon:yes gene_type:complete
MRVVNRDEFLELPSCTVYRKYSFNDEALYIKGPTINHDGENIDWWYTSFNEIENTGSNQYIDRVQDMAESGAQYPLGVIASRDGLYEKGDMFYVLDKHDVMKIIGFLSDALD